MTSVAENVGVGVHFNAFVPWHNKVLSAKHIYKPTLFVERLYYGEALYLLINITVKVVYSCTLGAETHAILVYVDVSDFSGTCIFYL